MNDRFFPDTNIFVYSFDRGARAKAKRSVSLIKDAVTSGKGIVSYQVVQEFLNVALKRFEKPLTTSEAEQYLATVFPASFERIRITESVSGSATAEWKVSSELVRLADRGRRHRGAVRHALQRRSSARTAHWPDRNSESVRVRSLLRIRTLPIELHAELNLPRIGACRADDA